MMTFEKIATGQGNDCTTGCLLDFTNLKEIYKLIAIDLSKQRAIDANRKAIQQINFNGNLNQDGNTTMFFGLEEGRKTI